MQQQLMWMDHVQRNRSWDQAQLDPLGEMLQEQQNLQENQREQFQDQDDQNTQEVQPGRNIRVNQSVKGTVVTSVPRPSRSARPKMMMGNIGNRGGGFSKEGDGSSTNSAASPMMLRVVSPAEISARSLAVHHVTKRARSPSDHCHLTEDGDVTAVTVLTKRTTRA